MRLRTVLAVLALTVLLVMPVASATNSRIVGAGGSGGFTKAFIAFATDDITVGTTYDFEPADGSPAYWIVKACYVSDNPTTPTVCVREDLAPLLA